MLIQGQLPRPSEIEVYLGNAGIYYRPIAEAQPMGAGAPAGLVAGIALSTFWSSSRETLERYRVPRGEVDPITGDVNTGQHSPDVCGKGESWWTSWTIIF